MTDFNPNSQSMYLALKDFYPGVTPSVEFVGNVFKAFEETISPDNTIEHPWAVRLEKWLPDNTGLLRDPSDGNWVKFRIVDEKLYTLALLKYS